MMKGTLSPVYTWILAGLAVWFPTALPATASARDLEQGLRAVEDFRAQYGTHWLVRMDWGAGVPYLVWGGAIDLGRTPVTDADFVVAARAFIDRHWELFGFHSDGLELEGVHRFSFAGIGASDKVSVHFNQYADDMPVRGGRVILTFDVEGRLLALENHGLQGLDDMDLIPEIDTETALNIAAHDYTARGFLRPSGTTHSGVVLVDARRDNLQMPTVAHVLRLDGMTREGQPAPMEYVIGAGPVFGILDARSLISKQQPQSLDYYYEGEVKGYGSGRGLPDAPYNPPLPFGMPYLAVTYGYSGGYTAITDFDGAFGFTYGGSITKVTATLMGTWVQQPVENAAAGGNLSAWKNFTPNTPDTIWMNGPQSTEYETAQVNAFLQTGIFFHWLGIRDPLHPVIPLNKIVVNKNGTPCDAYYEPEPYGPAIHFNRADGGCVNMAYAPIVDHELGHHALACYNPVPFTPALNEGVADTFAMYVQDDAEVGKDYMGPGTFGRTGENTRSFCGDGFDNCWGSDPHVNGEVLMGAFWKIRKRLAETWGTAGKEIAEALFVGWLNQYDDDSIHTIINEHWLILDDVDGDIHNGTPHYFDINEGFKDQGFPGVTAFPIEILHAPVPDRRSQSAVPVTCTCHAQVDPGGPDLQVTKVSLFYSTDEGGSWTEVSMSPSGNPDEWTGTLPGQVSPETVFYYIRAEDDHHNVGWLPVTAPKGDWFAYNVGEMHPVGEVEVYDFEGPGDQGWTHGGTVDDWQRGDNNQACALDPLSSNDKMWGNDLGLHGCDGYYAPGASNWLASPAFDCTASVNTRIRYRRWLTVEDGNYDQSKVVVENPAPYTVWKNEATSIGATHHLDGQWVWCDHDISGIADGKDGIRVRFRMNSNWSVEFGGWNIDDFRIYSLTPSQGFFDYGEGHAGTSGYVPHLSIDGTPVVGGHIDYHVTQGLGGATGYLIISPAPENLPWKGGTLLVDITTPPAVWWPFTLSGTPNQPGAGAWSLLGVTLDDPSYNGLHLYHQALIEDSGASHGVAMTQGVEMIVNEP